MKRFVLGALFILAAVQPLSAQQAVEYKGKLDPELTLSRGMMTLLLEPMAEADRSQLPDKLKEDEQAFLGKMVVGRKPRIEAKIVCIESKTGEPYFYADQNLNGKFDADERFAASLVKENDKEYSEVMLKFPLSNSFYKFYPARLRYQKNAPPLTEKNAGKRGLMLPAEVFTMGKVDIDGKPVLVQYSFSYDRGIASPTSGYLGIDGNGDGKVDNGVVSPELAFAMDETVVFRVGNKYLSTKSLDVTTGEIILKSHPASDYQRIEFVMGAELPDYSFTDFDGKVRRLSEFRGKYLLIDFWGTWCVPCVGEIPHLKAAYEKYRSRGFEILGMDRDESVDKVKKFLAEKGVTWPQATTPSVKDLIDRRFRIISFPTLVLLDPQGKVISLGQKDQMKLRDKDLLETIEKLLPTKTGAEKPAKPETKN